jgi:nicotinamide-nucleotide amidase
LRIEIIAVGSELLTSHYLDTNSLYITGRLNELGLEVSFKTVVGDDQETLLVALQNSLARSNLIFIMGGLGPTDDDRTREALARVLGRPIVLDRRLLENIRAWFRRRKIRMSPANKRQAYLIDGAQSLDNKNGTAPGQWLETGSHRIVLLPGPPHELKPMFQESIQPRLERFRRSYLVRRVLKTTGLGESRLEDMIQDLYPKSRDLKVTLLASPGQVEIHIASASERSMSAADIKAERLEKKFLSRLGDRVFSISGEDLESVAGRLLRGEKKTLAIAESCTGGYLGHRLTNVPGSSDYFLGGILAYGNRAKIELLGVPEAVIRKYGAVSPRTAAAMAEGVRMKMSSDIGLSITGIAGPSGGTPRKPVGLVYIALASDLGTDVSRNLFWGKREAIKFQSSQKALDMLRRYLLAEENSPSKKPAEKK